MKKFNDFDSFNQVAQVFLTTVDFKNLVSNVVDRVLVEVAKLEHDFHIAVLGLISERDGEKILKRISFSQTETAKEVEANLNMVFHKIETPLTAKNNYCVRVINEQKPLLTHDYVDILHPPVTKIVCKKMQEAGGIKTSVIFPIILRNESIGFIIFSTKQYLRSLSKRELNFIRGISSVIGIAVENSHLFNEIEKEKKTIERANQRLQEIDALKDEFVSVASHELRTPMTAIKNYIWLALNMSQNTLSDKVKSQLDIAYRSTERLIHLVNDMLTISRIEGNRFEIQKEQLNFNQIAEDTYQELTPIADNKHIQFKLEIKNPELPIIGDMNKLREVVQNLVGNALKFTPENGQITITTGKVSDRVFISVQDTGPGISREDQGKLFVKFSKLEHSYAKTKEAGTGLGLYISQQIVKMHEGEIKVKSKLGEGSTFSIILPLAQTKNLSVSAIKSLEENKRMVIPDPAEV